MENRTTQDVLLAACAELLTTLSAIRSAGGPPPAAQATPLVEAVWAEPAQRTDALKALASPYLPLNMLESTLVRGFRGNPNHLRPRDENGPRLASDLLAFFRLHLRIMAALPTLVDLPPGGVPANDLHGDGGWCDLCGQCCCHCGTVSTAPDTVRYPPWFYHAIAGEPLWPQPFCPFLAQTLSQPRFFCAIHPIKPLACSRFDQADCQRGRPGRGYLP